MNVMERPKVSVIIPVYGVERYIEQCARSLFEQTMQDGIEYIFVDDCSPDKSIEILENVLREYPHRRLQTRIIRHTENQGLGGARKTGMEYATGEYIIHCDSDDWVEPDMYETLYRKATEENADIVGCDYIFEYAKKSVVVRQPCPGNNIQYISDLLSDKLHCGTCNKLIKRSVYCTAYKYGCEIFPMGINMWEDVLTVNQLIYYCSRISYVPEALYHYRRTNEGSYTYNKPSLSDMREVIKRLSDFLNRNNINVSLDKLKITVRHSYIESYPCVPKDIWSYMYPEIRDTHFLKRLYHQFLLFLATHHMIRISGILIAMTRKLRIDKHIRLAEQN